ncbi:MAG TPA: hypothetical protein VEQ59_07490, partial [Polyangiaceae bacterium]|nr:hypothetical protein [Polyangiaceae bacterium]
VPCDLPAIGTLLQRSVVEEVNRLGLALPASRLMLTATQTHAGPAHYLDGETSASAGSSELPGFDPDLVRFLSRSIASAIHRAYQARRPGSLRWVHDAPRLDVLELRVSDAEPLEEGVDASTTTRCSAGSLTFVASATLRLPAANRLLGADAFGVASRQVEAAHRVALAEGCPTDPLAGIINAHESAAPVRSGTIDEVIASGHALGRTIEAALQARTDFYAHPPLGARYVEVDLGQSRRLASGADDTELTSVLPFAVLRAGDSAISFVPTLLSAAAAADMKAAVVSAFRAARDPVVAVLAGSTNGDIAAAKISSREASRLTNALSKHLIDGRTALPAEPDRAGAFSYSLGPERRRLSLGRDQATLYDARSRRRALGLCTVKATKTLAVCFRWADVAPGAAPLVVEPSIGLRAARTEPDIWLDDRGTAFRTKVHGAAHDLWIWSTVFRPTAEQWRALADKGSLRVVTNLETGAVPVSAGFDEAHPPPDCTAEEQRQCEL